MVLAAAYLRGPGYACLGLSYISVFYFPKILGLLSVMPLKEKKHEDPKIVKTNKETDRQKQQTNKKQNRKQNKQTNKTYT